MTPSRDRAPPAEGGEGPGADALEFGRWLFAQDCAFVIGIASLDQLPPGGLPEVAFAGRSNVGKSSLLNALTGRRALARTSNTPGRTQQINFFNLGGRLMLADLPGYGFVRAPKHRVRDWTRLIDAYLRDRPSLRRLCLLIDARHGLKAADRAMMEMLDVAAVSYQIILTKSDKVKEPELQDRLGVLRETVAGYTAAHPEVLITSAVGHCGLAELRADLAALVAPA